MIKEVKLFTIICDQCGNDSNKDDDGVGYAADAKGAEEFATSADYGGYYKIIEGKHYCEDCWAVSEETGEFEVKTEGAEVK